MKRILRPEEKELKSLARVMTARAAFLNAYNSSRKLTTARREPTLKQYAAFLLGLRRYAKENAVIKEIVLICATLFKTYRDESELNSQMRTLSTVILDGKVLSPEIETWKQEAETASFETLKEDYYYALATIVLMRLSFLERNNLPADDDCDALVRRINDHEERLPPDSVGHKTAESVASSLFGKVWVSLFHSAFIDNENIIEEVWGNRPPLVNSSLAKSKHTEQNTKVNNALPDILDNCANGLQVNEAGLEKLITLH